MSAFNAATSGEAFLPEVRCPCCHALWLKGAWIGAIRCRKCGKPPGSLFTRSLTELAQDLANLYGQTITIQGGRQGGRMMLATAAPNRLLTVDS